MTGTINLRHNIRTDNIIRLMAQPETGLKSEMAGHFTQVKNTATLPDIWNSSVTKNFINKIKTSFSSLFSRIKNISSSFKKETSLQSRATGTDTRNKTSAVTETVKPMTAEQKKMVTANVTTLCNMIRASFAKDEKGVRNSDSDGLFRTGGAISKIKTTTENLGNGAIDTESLDLKVATSVIKAKLRELTPVDDETFREMKADPAQAGSVLADKMALMGAEEKTQFQTLLNLFADTYHAADEGNSSSFNKESILISVFAPSLFSKSEAGMTTDKDTITDSQQLAEIILTSSDSNPGDIEADTISIDSGRGSSISDSDTLSVRSDDVDDISKKSVASRYEKDDSDLAHYGRSKRDDGRKTAFDAVSYLTTSLTNKSDKPTLKTQDIDDINALIKENKLTFYDIKSRAVTHGDLKIIRELALNKPEEDFYENIEEEDFYENIENDLDSLSQLLATPSDTEKKIDTVMEEMEEMEEMDAMSDEENDAMNNMEWDDEFGSNR